MFSVLEPLELGNDKQRSANYYQRKPKKRKPQILSKNVLSCSAPSTPKFRAKVSTPNSRKSKRRKHSAVKKKSNPSPFQLGFSNRCPASSRSRLRKKRNPPESISNRKRKENETSQMRTQLQIEVQLSEARKFKIDELQRQLELLCCPSSTRESLEQQNGKLELDLKVMKTVCEENQIAYSSLKENEARIQKDLQNFMKRNYELGKEVQRLKDRSRRIEELEILETEYEKKNLEIKHLQEFKRKQTHKLQELQQISEEMQKYILKQTEELNDKKTKWRTQSRVIESQKQMLQKQAEQLENVLQQFKTRVAEMKETSYKKLMIENAEKEQIMTQFEVSVKERMQISDELARLKMDFGRQKDIYKKEVGLLSQKWEVERENQDSVIEETERLRNEYRVKFCHGRRKIAELEENIETLQAKLSREKSEHQQTVKNLRKKSEAAIPNLRLSSELLKLKSERARMLNQLVEKDLQRSDLEDQLTIAKETLEIMAVKVEKQEVAYFQLKEEHLNLKRDSSLALSYKEEAKNLKLGLASLDETLEHERTEYHDLENAAGKEQTMKPEEKNSYLSTLCDLHKSKKYIELLMIEKNQCASYCEELTKQNERLLQDAKK